MLDQILTPLLVVAVCLAVSGIILLVYRRMLTAKTDTDKTAQPQEASAAPADVKKKKRQISFVTPRETQVYLHELFGSIVLDPEWQRYGGSKADLRDIYPDPAEMEAEAAADSEQPAFGIKIEYVPIRPGEAAAPSITFMNARIEFSTAPIWSVLEGEEYINLDPATGQITGVAEGSAKLQAILTDENGNSIRAYATVEVVSFREEELEEAINEGAENASVAESAGETAAPVQLAPAEITGSDTPTADTPAPDLPFSETPESEVPTMVAETPALAAAAQEAQTSAADGTANTAAEPPYPYEPSTPDSATAIAVPSLNEQINSLPDIPDSMEPLITRPTVAPEFAPGNSWMRRIDKNIVTSITLVDSYSPDGTEKVSWDASSHRSRTLTAYLLADGKSLVIAGNGYGEIYANPNACQMFGNFKRLKRIHGLHLLNTRRTTNMNSMFYNDNALIELDLSGFNTSGVKDMGYMFYCCTALLTLDLSSFTTAAVQGICFMFYNCVKLRTIFVSPAWDVSTVTNDSAMFSYCLSLEGGEGTVYDYNLVHRSQAVIDDDSHPGYLTRSLSAY